MALIGIALAVSRLLTSRFPSLYPAIDAISTVVINQYLTPIFVRCGDVFWFIVGYGGIVTLVCIVCILMTGVARFCAFSAIGVMEQVSSQDKFLNFFFGTVSITMVPEGASQAIVLDGRALFNHVNIHDDAQTVGSIARFIEDALSSTIPAWRASGDLKAGLMR